MAVCYFNSDFKKKYDCEYEIENGSIKIIVEYDIMDEIEAVNGVKTYGGSTEFAERDILIVDFQTKKNYLAKECYYAGANRVFATLDSGAKTTFRSRIFFSHEDVEKLANLPVTPKAKSIKVFSKSILDWIGYPSLSKETTDDSLEIKLSRTYRGISVPLNANYIKQITVSDDWNSLRNSNERNITIDFSGYIEIELTKRVNYDKISEFVNELLIYMQLYSPDRFLIDKIFVLVDDTYYAISIPLMEINHKDKYVEKTVDESLLDFLKKCYTSIPYRNSKTEIRNIPFIVLKTTRNIEDNFLMFYRFIECYYKKKHPEGRTKFISISFSQHYNQNGLTEEQIEKYIQEIICLRNHYVHSGYYIKNSSLRIAFDKIGRRRNPKDYTVNNVDINWVYERTRILYRIAVDIIYKDMLGYSEHRFRKHF